MKTDEYIKNIKKSGFFSGDFEISQSIYVFRINIAIYEKIYADNEQILEYKFINYLENENYANSKIPLLILVYEKDATHYNQLLYNDNIDFIQENATDINRSDNINNNLF